LIDRDEFRVRRFVNVGDGGFVKERAVLLLAHFEHLLHAEAIELGGSAGGEDAKDEQPARLGGHWPLVEDGEVAEDLAIGIAERDTEITLDPHFGEGFVAGEFFCDAGWVMAGRAGEHVFAGGAVEIEFDGRGDLVLGPIGERADAGLGAGELGDEGVLDIDRGGQVADERIEELGPVAWAVPSTMARSASISVSARGDVDELEINSPIERLNVWMSQL
jgi:hypothetical protein